LVATGSFTVAFSPMDFEGAAGGSHLGRRGLNKRFSGDLEGSSVGQILSAMTDTAGSASYVAIEQVTATLAGRSGSFVLQHSGVMDRGAASLSVSVVPDSGTGDLVGLSGRMDIEIAAGEHRYRFDYGLAAAG
jgi:hypothetical protein